MPDYARELYDRLLAGGEAEILAELQRADPEHVHLDFKRANTPLSSYAKARGAALDDSDLSNLGKALSGFANTLGGVIVWGVDCAGNNPAARAITPGIENVGAYKGTLRSLLGKATVPGLSEVLLDEVPLPSLPGRSALLMYVPRREFGPVQAAIGKGADRFFFRAGDDFKPVTYDMLAAMFGKTPPADIIRKLVFGSGGALVDGALVLEFGLLLRNHGVGLARRPFLTLMVQRPSDPSEIFIQSAGTEWFDEDHLLGHFSTFMAREEHPLPYGALAQVATFSIKLVPPFTRQFRFYSTVGAEGALPRESVIRVDPKAILAVLNKARRRKHRIMSQQEAWSLLTGTSE